MHECLVHLVSMAGDVQLEPIFFGLLLCMEGLFSRLYRIVPKDRGSGMGTFQHVFDNPSNKRDVVG